MEKEPIVINVSDLVGGKLYTDLEDAPVLNINQNERTKLNITLTQEMLRMLRAGERVILEDSSLPVEVEIRAEPKHSER